MLKNKRLAANLGPSHVSGKSLWKSIWHASAHNIIMNFLWRLAKKFMLVRYNLLIKGANTTDECPICHNSVEIECYENTYKGVIE